MKPATLAELKTAWLAAKAAEAAAQQERRAIEDAMLAMLPSKTEGTVTDKDSGITAAFKVTRKVDTQALQARWATLPGRAQEAFTWKAEVSTSKLKTLADFDEAAHRAASEFITTTPAKPAISVKTDA